MPDQSENYEHDPKPLIRPTMMSGLCSMVPVPFLDDMLLRRVRKGMVHRILQENGVALAPDAIKPVYAGVPKGCFATTIGLVIKGIKKILRKLLRTVFFFLAIRASALDMGETFLMGRTVERCLGRGLLKEKSVSREEALRIRAAFNEALSGADRRVLAQAMRAGWKRVGGMRRLARMMAGRFREDSEREIQPEDLDTEERAAIEQGGQDVERQVETREVQEFLEGFDSRFDQALENARTKMA